ncbi:transcription cofactor vestigial-like protein 1 isoform X2 [Periophthalmus magnuspinnatus]|uniref:transcription cofactor vestigial-like protein 1 isoform X2 n=1 Tax=Periophthalmus magnuspinnatus TaxID=409849 RepID=UPI002437234E|nr:transcription cofactor vestigial-like protein 1 isoform X2 [Periophthalmus magnuspinnatus]
MLVNMATLGHLYPNIKPVADDRMENPTESPIAVKVEEHSQSLILTYFHGDINSMVDAHFSRALNKASKAKAPAAKLKKIPKKIKKEDIRVFQDTPADTYPEPQVRPVTEHLVSFTPAEELCSPWHAFPSRTGEGTGLTPMGCSLSPNDLSVTGQQCSTSLLNLLHNDRTEMAPSLSSSLSSSLSPSLSSSSKPELLPNWMVPQADPSTVFEPGRRLDKKDLYWY